MSKISYSAVFVDPYSVNEYFDTQYDNFHCHHSTIEIQHDNIDDLELGKKVKMKVTGRLITDKVDVILVDNKFSKKEHPHITLSTKRNILPSESDSEIKNNLDKVKSVENIYIEGIIGYSKKNETFPEYSKSLTIYKDMDINEIIDSEYDMINESLKTIFGGAALMYALTFPINLGADSSNSIKSINKEVSQEFGSKLGNDQLINIMDNASKKYPQKLFYNKTRATSIEDGLKSILGNNKGLKDLPYRMIVKNDNNGVELHVLSGDEKTLNYFGEKYLVEK